METLLEAKLPSGITLCEPRFAEGTQKRIDELEHMLRRLESRYSQSNPSDVMEIRSLKREIKRLQVLAGEGKTDTKN